MQTDPTPIRDKIARHVPHVLWSHQDYPTDKAALAEWAVHLQSLDWTEGFQWPVPLEYEKLYQGVPDKASWLRALNELLDVVTPCFVDSNFHN